MSKVMRGMSRRDAFRALAGLGLVACNTSKPQKGGLGAMERLDEKVESFLLGDYEPTAGELTPAAAFPVYHVAPEVPIQPDGWRLIIGGRVARPLALTLDDLRKLPRTDVRIQHYCVEGWSATADWSGVRLSEIAKLVGAKDVEYVELRSFDVPQYGTRGYWSSWDRESAMHPQTLLAYGMNGKPLAPAHGAPVRLYGAVKLGYKSVKYLTEVNFLDVRTGGYWEDQGYEWFAGV
jgi:DMSO/TMAO reductase YedYZ molybdopterin-dependent catalytic subunit